MGEVADVQLSRTEEGEFKGKRTNISCTEESSPNTKNGVTEESSSETSENRDSDNELRYHLLKTTTKKGTVTIPTKKDNSSESFESEDDDDVPKVYIATKSGPVDVKAALTTAPKKKDQSSDNSESDSDSDDEILKPPLLKSE